jgi:hypothetical protein
MISHKKTMIYFEPVLCQYAPAQSLLKPGFMFSDVMVNTPLPVLSMLG